jgi:hypothetical protein
MQAWLPLVNRARFAVLSGTVTMVPSTAQTSRPRHHVPAAARDRDRAAQQIEQPAQWRGATRGVPAPAPRPSAPPPEGRPGLR